MAVLIYPSLQQPVLTTAQFPESVHTNWYQQWVDPNLWVKTAATVAVALIAASGQTLDPFPRGTPEFIGPDKWMQPFSERLYAKPGLRPELQQTLAYSESAQFPETTTIDRYLYPFSEPVRIKPAVQAGNQPVFQFQPNPVISIGWFQELSKPASLAKVGLRPELQQTLAYSESAQFPESTTIDRYLYPFSEPVRVKPRLIAAANPFHFAMPFPASEFFVPHQMPWFAPLSEPVRLKFGTRLPSSEQHYVEQDIAPTYRQPYAFGWVWFH